MSNYDIYKILDNNGDTPIVSDRSKLVCRYEDFINLSRDLIRVGQERLDIKAEDILPLVPQFSRYRAHEMASGVGAITYHLSERMAAKMGNHQHKKGRFSGLERNPNRPNSLDEIRTYDMDHKVVFTVYSKESSIADQKALWLERFLKTRDYVYRFYGVSQFEFIKRGIDTVLENNSSVVFVRPLTFHVRLNEPITITKQVIRQGTIT